MFIPTLLKEAATYTPVPTVLWGWCSSLTIYEKQKSPSVILRLFLKNMFIPTLL